MKGYEQTFTSVRIDQQLPVYARLDGRSFSSFTRDMQKPCDNDMLEIMVRTTEYLVKETKADLGYTQSDEISLLWKPIENPLSEFMFGGKLQKLTSVLASMCSSAFVREYFNVMGCMSDNNPSFDCRVLNLPTLWELENMLRWRAQDCRKNAISSAAHYILGPRKIDKRSSRDRLMLLSEAGYDFENLPTAFRLGTYITRENVVISPDRYPEGYQPSEPVIRSKLVRSHIGTVLDSNEISPI